MLKIFNKNKKRFHKKTSEKGVTLVIAITTMTLLLSISLSISNIVLRQIKITNINNASKPAFFVADSAIECAFYYDTAYIVLDPDIDTVNINEDFSTAVFGANANIENIIKCGESAQNKPLAVTKDITNPDQVITRFDIDYDNMCAKVEVIRTEVQTTITSRGYNTTADSNGCDLSNLNTRRLVERGLTITY